MDSLRLISLSIKSIQSYLVEPASNETRYLVGYRLRRTLQPVDGQAVERFLSSPTL